MLAGRSCGPLRRFVTNSQLQGVLQDALNAGDVLGPSSAQRRSVPMEALRPIREHLHANLDLPALHQLYTTPRGTKEPVISSLFSLSSGTPLGTRLLHWLCWEKLPNASTLDRAILVCALRTAAQEQRSAAYTAYSDAWCHVLLDTHDGVLLQLKDAINVASAAFDMHQLVMRDTRAEVQRAQLISHFARALQQPRRSQQVMSDYDDTLQAMWLERRLPLGTVYPGAVAFLVALQQYGGHAPGGMNEPMWWDKFAAGGEVNEASGASSSSMHATPVRFETETTDAAGARRHWLHPLRAAAARISSSMLAESQAALDRARLWLISSTGGDALRAVVQKHVVKLKELPRLEAAHMDERCSVIPSSIVFVTARPADPRSIIKRRTLENLRSLPFHHVIVLLGSLLKLTSITAMVGKKLDNIMEYSLLFPEHRIVFVGDSGQGDAAVGARLLKNPLQRQTIVFIHELDPQQTHTGDGGTKAAYKAATVRFFRNYVHAASLALQADAVQPIHAAIAATCALREMALLVKSHVIMPPPQAYTPDGIPLKDSAAAGVDVDRDLQRFLEYAEQLLEDVVPLQKRLSSDASAAERDDLHDAATALRAEMDAQRRLH